jgi:hypothetical protein
VQFIAILYSLSPPNYNLPVHVNTSYCLKFNESRSSAARDAIDKLKLNKGEHYRQINANLTYMHTIDFDFIRKTNLINYDCLYAN